MPSGSFTLAEELFARGDAAFVGELRRVDDAERLGKFAGRWLADPRPIARQMLIDYLSLPLNAYRHEALVKRLFKEIEKSADDELMGVLMVAMDRSIRRERKSKTRYKWHNAPTRAEAEEFLHMWSAQGYAGNIQTHGNRFYATLTKTEEIVVSRRDTMPRPDKSRWGRHTPIQDYLRQRFEKRFILFSQPTRHYLRRRAWRYFRKLGKTNSERYRTTAVAYLKRYTDADVDSDVHLLDNWGLLHTLFHDSPALVRPAKGWAFAEGKSLADLTPAPCFADAWLDAPDALLELLMHAGCRTVRQWAAWLLRARHRDWLSRQSIVVLLKLIDHADADAAALGFELIEGHADLSSLPVEAWLARLEGDDLEKLQRLAALLEKKLDPARVPPPETVKLAMYRSLPVARLGLSLLRRNTDLAPADIPTLLPLTQAECAALRSEIAEWLREKLQGWGPPPSDWLLDFLDSKHTDVRSVGWTWLQATSFKDEPAVWHKLLETPYADIKGLLIDQLTTRAKGADADVVRMLWASVLLNLYGGGRHKPGVVAQIVLRLADHPTEGDRLLPLLAVAVRSLRGPEFRTGLTGVVRLLEEKPELQPSIAKQFPELVV